ncbi:MAG: triple tyrosine motif-containing protein [Dokdonella sp.]
MSAFVRVLRRPLAAALMGLFVPEYSACAHEQAFAQMDRPMWIAQDAAPPGIRALAQAPDGTSWIGSEGGLFNFDRSTFTAFKPPAGDVDSCDGARDGDLWFVTLNGAPQLAPEHPTARSPPPSVSIRSIAADRHLLDAKATFGPKPQTLEIRYFGVNPAAPERVIYQYRLEGLDDTWQEAGHRTAAIYTRLQAGTYTFRVMASNGDGVWSAPVSSAAFTVLPSFYQTTGFALLCACAGLVLLSLTIRMRVRAITRAVRARAEERADERIRIARELHDTLLQGIQGLLLTFHVAAQKISADDESKTLLERALSTADRIIIEGRNRVSRLRSEHLTDAELLGSLENVGNDLKLDDSVQYRVHRSGTNATLYAHIADEVFYMAREALTNAFRHAAAAQINLELIYGKRFFMLVCEDNGRGFGAADQDTPEHWGLKGIAERARKVGGELRCRSQPLHGTEILVSIPSYRAYRHHSRLMFYLRALSISGSDRASRRAP